ncbi:hypothetical protein MFLAVUS_007969 [Mucor flavus]|uniref:Rrp15p-domain-containing protein n=1 Tax=Mucor flavus TaxID=439312 RepID=A0ABP9Z5U2_9FUNG
MAAKKQVQKKVVNKKVVAKESPEKPVEKVVEKVVEEEIESSESDKNEEDEEMKDSENEDADAEDDESDDEDEDENDEFDAMDVDGGAVRQPKKYSSEAFSEAMTKILGSTLTGSDKRQPILARSKGLERKLEDEKLDYKARKIISAEKKALKEKGRIIPDFTTFEYEKRLRKVATRGVVKLFNAIRTQQKVTEVAVQSASEKRKTLVAIEKAKSVSTMSKSSFLDLLKTGQK